MDFTHEELKVMQSAIDHYGEESQLDMAIEEMSELTKAIRKHKRLKEIMTFNSLKSEKIKNDYYDFFACLDNAYEEIADVYIMLEQLMMIFDCEQRVSAIASKKIIRVIRRIDNGDS